MNDDTIRYTSDGRKIGKGAELRIMSDLEAFSFHIEWKNNNQNVIRYDSIEEFIGDIND